MKHEWLHKKSSGRLIIFCNGWGMDEQPVKFLQSNSYDVLMLFDYSSIVPEIDIGQLFRTYKTVSLLSWSMGVWAGQQIFAEYQDGLKRAIAVNGTLCPIDDQYGIPEKTVWATLDNFDEKRRLKFYHRMCREREVYRNFLKNQPRRTVNDQKEELAVLLEMASCRKKEKYVYSEVIIADHDFIIPTKNQLRFWPEKRVKLVAGSHFLFYSYNCWDQLIAVAEEVEGSNGFTS